jgi:hypothetical protein
MKIKNLSFILGVAVTMFATSCTKQEQLGPEIKSATKDFKFVQELTITELNFTQSKKPEFIAQFNEEVSWKLRLIGLTSGAEQIFTGLSNGFNSSTINWEGRSNNIYFFRKGERVATELTITGIRDKFFGDTIVMNNPVRYHNQVYNGVKHIIIDNFENSSVSSIDSASLDIIEKGKSPDANDVDVVFNRVNTRAVNGNFSMMMSGNDVNRNSWSGDIYSEFVFNFYFNSNSLANVVIDSGIDPKNLYFNLFIFGNGSSSAGVQIKIYELDSKIGGATEFIKNRRQLYDFAFTKNSQGTPANSYNQRENDGWIYSIPVNWVGWKLVSVPYSEFRPAGDPAAGGNGDRKKESWRICGAALSLLSEPSGNKNEVFLDMFTITQNGRFQF